MLYNNKSIRQVSLKPLAFIRITQRASTSPSSNDKNVNLYDAYDACDANKEREKISEPEIIIQNPKKSESIKFPDRVPTSYVSHTSYRLNNGIEQSSTALQVTKPRVLKYDKSMDL